MSMKDLGDATLQSIAEEKGKHIAAGSTAGGGTAVAANDHAHPHEFQLTGDLITDALIIIPRLAVLAGFLLSLFLIYKTYLELRLVKIRIAKEDRRDG